MINNEVNIRVQNKHQKVQQPGKSRQTNDVAVFRKAFLDLFSTFLHIKLDSIHILWQVTKGLSGCPFDHIRSIFRSPQNIYFVPTKMKFSEIYNMKKLRITHATRASDHY